MTRPAQPPAWRRRPCPAPAAWGAAGMQQVPPRRRACGPAGMTTRPPAHREATGAPMGPRSSARGPAGRGGPGGRGPGGAAHSIQYISPRDVRHAAARSQRSCRSGAQTARAAPRRRPDRMALTSAGLVQPSARLPFCCAPPLFFSSRFDTDEEGGSAKMTELSPTALGWSRTCRRTGRSARRATAATAAPTAASAPGPRGRP